MTQNGQTNILDGKRCEKKESTANHDNHSEFNAI